MCRMSAGREFQTDGPATENARSPNLVYVGGTVYDKNSSGDEIANVNFYAEARKLPEFAEITQYNRHYAIQGNSRSPILIPIES